MQWHARPDWPFPAGIRRLDMPGDLGCDPCAGGIGGLAETAEIDQSVRSDFALLGAEKWLTRRAHGLLGH